MDHQEAVKTLGPSRVFFLSDLPEPPFIAVIAAQHKGKWVLVREKGKDTYELPAGHIEPGETPLQAAQRELYEESGAVECTIHEVCPYGVQFKGMPATYGVLFYTQVERFEDMPDFEMAERILVDTLPQQLTYANIQPLLIKKVQAWLKAGNPV